MSVNDDPFYKFRTYLFLSFRPSVLRYSEIPCILAGFARGGIFLFKIDPSRVPRDDKECESRTFYKL